MSTAKKSSKLIVSAANWCLPFRVWKADSRQMDVVQHCFPPVVRPDTRLLILGSLPGAASLAAARYYAHPRNQFWQLAGHVTGCKLAELPYEQRLARLLDAGIGLWDTVAAAVRPGSLDADIRLHEASDVRALADTLPRLAAIAFNGGASARIGRRQLGDGPPWALIDLPSSSPAYTMPLADKAEVWQRLRLYLQRRRRTSEAKHSGAAPPGRL
jgi:hypoxanthine-DNA glycosylase